MIYATNRVDGLRHRCSTPVTLHGKEVFDGSCADGGPDDAVTFAPRRQDLGGAAEIVFPANGFSAGACTVDGLATNYAHYVKKNGIDIKLPLGRRLCRRTGQCGAAIRR